MKKCRGVALVEVMVALGIFSIVFSSMWALVFQVDRSALSSQIFLDELRGDGEMVERAALLSFTSDALPSTQYPYVAPCLMKKEATSTEFFIADVLEVWRRGGDCGGYMNWFENPRLSLWQNNDSLNGVAGATGVDVLKQYVVVSLMGDDITAPDLAMGRIDGDRVRNVRTLDTGVAGINAIDAAGGFIFAAQRDSARQVSVTALTSRGLEMVASTTLPGVAGQYPEGWSVFYYNERLYVGTKRTAGHEFHIFDVSQPQNPVWLGSKEINHNVNAIVVKENRAFLATSGNVRDLIVLDVSDPASIVKIAELDVTGGEDGKSVAVMGSVLYLGRLKSVRGNPDFVVINIDDVSAGSLRAVGSYTVGADVNSIRIAHHHAFLATAKNGGEIVVLNTSSSTNITLEQVVSLGQKVTGIDYQDSVFGVSVFGSESFSVLFPHEN